ncbi:MAG: class I SAM-dependent methyltransferase [Solirubrobacterales bacterium]|nr:class I SAM-dependent methyltransferase [Solirubrobacterales bacterium]
MATPLTHGFVQDLLEAVALPDPVVEFGALQVEPGQDGDLRPLFAGRDYLGTDLRPGPGVDRVEDLRALTLEDGSVGTALCLDTLEHCADPPQACRELARVTAPGGVCVIASVMLFGIHAYPSDFFRFTPEGFRTMLEQGFDDAWAIGLGHPGLPTFVLGVGAKGRALDLGLDRLPRTAAAQRDYDAAPGRIRLGALRYGPRQLAREVAPELARLARERLRRGRGF